MSDEYELQVLLELREQERENAEDEYARELAELQRRREFVERKEAELRAAVARRRRECDAHDQKVRAGELALAQIRQFDAFLDGLRHDETSIEESIERARASVEQQQRDVQKAKDALIEATKELEAVAKHRENWEEEQAIKDQRRRSAAMDDVAARRWMEQNR